jgi:hypothetical protein
MTVQARDRKSGKNTPQEARARNKKHLEERDRSSRSSGKFAGSAVTQTVTDTYGGLFTFVGGSCGPSLGTRYMGRGKQVFGAPPSRQRNEDDKPKRHRRDEYA